MIALFDARAAALKKRGSGKLSSENKLRYDRDVEKDVNWMPAKNCLVLFWHLLTVMGSQAVTDALASSNGEKAR